LATQRSTFALISGQTNQQGRFASGDCDNERTTLWVLQWWENLFLKFLNPATGYAELINCVHTEKMGG